MRVRIPFFNRKRTRKPSVAVKLRCLNIQPPRFFPRKAMRDERCRYGTFVKGMPSMDGKSVLNEILCFFAGQPNGREHVNGFFVFEVHVFIVLICFVTVGWFQILVKP